MERLSERHYPGEGRPSCEDAVDLCHREEGAMKVLKNGERERCSEASVAKRQSMGVGKQEGVSGRKVNADPIKAH